MPSSAGNTARAIHDGSLHSGSRERVPALDSIRAIAIAFVVLRHAWPGVFGAGGFAGVEIFFVLSGFLITSILISDERSGILSYKRFYANRALRLYPALLAVLLCTGVVVAAVDPVGDRSNLVGGLVTGLTYTSDIPKWPLHQLSELTHLWTLAVEEQFYILWPVLLVTSMRRKRLRAFCWTALLLTAASLLLSVAYGLHNAEITAIYTWPTTWAVTLIWGGLYAVRVVKLPTGRLAGGGAVIGLVALCFVPNAKSDALGYLVVLPAVAMLAGLLVANAAGEQPLRFLLHPWVRYLGRISYGVYLWNYPLVHWTSGVLAIPLSVVAAAASFSTVERVFLRLRRRPPVHALDPQPASS